MTKKHLILWSAGRDLLNFTGIGAIPPFSSMLDLPLLVMHFNYAGKAAVFTLLEAIPVVGIFPFFTVAMMYPNREAGPRPRQPDCESGKIEHIGMPQSDFRILPATQTSQKIFALVDGKLLPVIVPGTDGARPLSLPNLHEQ